MHAVSIGRSATVVLREKEAQLKRNSRSFDYTLAADGKIHPAVGNEFMGPNGMTLRPNGSNMYIVQHARDRVYGESDQML